ncbi:hypothetical protein CW354_21930 [Marinicaulis flavus]|uniref:Uncharacterized protein n=1 Tax=Hyphococcus luteus TaxID=2058213 RepID=A0A2S7JZA8_9PROT|nr:hypothetical protein CW354_21930 [Marinicaulis flavus]
METKLKTPEAADPGEKIGRRFAIFCVYLVLGPPVGGLFLIAGALLTAGASVFTGNGDGISSGSGWDTIFGVFALTPLVLMFSYLFGGLQAAATGLFLAVFSGKEGRFGYILAVLAPVPPGLVALFVMGRDGLSGGLALGLLGILASVTLRFVFRKSFGRRPPEL